MFYHPSNQDGLLNRFFSFMFSKQTLSRLILLNTIFFLLAGMEDLYVFLFNIKDVFPAGLSSFVFNMALPAEIAQMVIRPWTPLTSMFVHASFWHFLLNIFMLYFSGVIFSSMVSNGKLWITYLAGGLSGALFFIGAYNFFPVFAPIISMSYALGASAAIMAILFAAVAYAPNYSLRLFLFGQIQLKYLALIFVLIDLLSITASNPGGHIAHIGGAVFGLMYGFSIRSHFKIKLRPFFKRKPRMKTRTNNNYRPETDHEYRDRRVAENKRIDAMLDKISKGGYDTLTKDEKDFLFRHGRK